MMTRHLSFDRVLVSLAGNIREMQPIVGDTIMPEAIIIPCQILSRIRERNILKQH